MKRKKFKGGVNPPKHLGIIMLQLKVLVGIQKPMMLMLLPLGGIMLMIPMLVIGVIIKPPKIIMIGVQELLFPKKIILLLILLMMVVGTLVKKLKIIIGSNNLKPMILGMEMKVRKMKILPPMNRLQLLNLKKTRRLLTNTVPRKPKSH